ncbi:putative nonstructural protein [Ferak virus]|uniref:Putative nonstructural protein n=1 Tax=Ferak virus TaxID=1664810 RepID=A0A0H4B2T6_9VIRU|nr:putative nonstructural protein [Ferak virus]AKN56891.1 putative nonstructural protein [Ferak virus]AKN56911.1 putative nonstructural protein [Ferak virus]AKN56916.1 putative nonstructural protein [Ferak virus]
MIFALRVIRTRDSSLTILVNRVKPFQTLKFNSCDYYLFSDSLTCLKLNQNSIAFIIRSGFGLEANYQGLTIRELPDFLTDLTKFNLSVTDYNFITIKINDFLNRVEA